MERNTCWPCYDIKTFRNSTYDNYNVARSKTKKAEYTSASDLNSEIENQTKRKRIKNRLYESDSDDCDQKNNSSTKQKQLKEDEMIKKKTKIIQYFKNSENSEDSEYSEESNSILPKHPQITESATNIKMNSNPSGFKTMKQTFNTCDSLNNNTGTSLNNAPHSFTQDNSDNSRYFKEIIRQQGFFKTQLWQMEEDLRKIKDIVIGNLQQNQDVNKQNEKSIYFSFDLPLKTVEEMEGAVEEFLKISENFERSLNWQHKFRVYLFFQCGIKKINFELVQPTMETRIVGGTSPYNFIKRNLCRLITNELAVQYSWLGAKLKRQFSNLRITNMLLAAGVAYCDSYTKLELEKAIQK